MTAHSHLFEPLDLRHKTLRNRIVFGAHTANMAEDGLPGERHLGYYLERARGGAAMIVVEPVPVHATAVLTRGNFRHNDDSIIPAFRKITEACKAEGAVMLNQLYHVGQHGDFDLSYQPNWSPSGLPSFHDSDGSHKMTEVEIEEVIMGFVAAARRAYEAGFDGVELFAAYNALIDQFWLPWNNRRDDRWGGCFENRMRFSTEIITRIRKQVGEDFIIGIATASDHNTDIALSNEALQEIAAYYDARALIDYISCGTASYFDFAELMPTFFFAEKLGVPLAESLKQVVKHTRIQAESHIRTPENANTVIAAQQADMVSIVRGQIADPHLANKAKEGRDADVRGCISCNQMCWGRRSRDYWISCLVNPSAGREFEWGGDRFSPSDAPRHVLVIGGGPAGLECARVAAERGHRVTLVEASGELGGQFRLAGLQPRRGQISELIQWYNRQLEKLNVRVKFHSYVEAGEIEDYHADCVVIATGSLPSDSGFQRGIPGMDELPGVDKANVWSVEDVMSRAARPGNKVMLIDDTSDWRGGGTALHLAQQGHAVIIITGAAMVGKSVQRTAGDVTLRQQLKKYGVMWMTESVVMDWRGDGGTVRGLLDGMEVFIEADGLVLATTNIAETTLLNDLAGRDLEVHSIGDCVSPRLAVAAIYEGRVLAMKL